jgi:hypothetical protein
LMGILGGITYVDGLEPGCGRHSLEWGRYIDDDAGPWSLTPLLILSVPHAFLACRMHIARRVVDASATKCSGETVSIKSVNTVQKVLL